MIFKYSKIEEKIVYFKPQGVGAFQRVPVKQIQTLKLKDGQIIIGYAWDNQELNGSGKCIIGCIMAVVGSYVLIDNLKYQ